MPKTISFFTLRPGVEAQRVLEVLPDLGEDVLPRVWITALASLNGDPDEALRATQEFMFETTDESTAENSALVNLQLFKLLVNNLHLGQMRTFQSFKIGVRRPDSGQGRATVEILDKVK